MKAWRCTEISSIRDQLLANADDEKDVVVVVGASGDNLVWMWKTF